LDGDEKERKNKIKFDALTCRMQPLWGPAYDDVLMKQGKTAEKHFFLKDQPG
jgi:hypothetical protein